MDICLNTLSYDAAVNQWIMLCHKNCMTKLIITVWHIHVASLTTSMSTMLFLIKINFILKAINFEGHMINRSLHSLSFHMKFMKQAWLVS